MEAKELFNRLGFLIFNFKKDERYSIYTDEDISIVYFNKRTNEYIWFFKKHKFIDFNHQSYCGNHFKLSNNLIKAINKQMIELDWRENKNGKSQNVEN